MGVIKKSSLFAIAFLGLFVCSARAQGTITVKVPFPFVVDHQEFPAGQYDVREVENAGTVLSIEGANHKLASFVLTMNAGGDDPAGDCQPACHPGFARPRQAAGAGPDSAGAADAQWLSRRSSTSVNRPPRSRCSAG